MDLSIVTNLQILLGFAFGIGGLAIGGFLAMADAYVKKNKKDDVEPPYYFFLGIASWIPLVIYLLALLATG